jgi:two-component system, OmpR family, phosphate regulon sensor histidine kinase PhoR
MTDKITILVVDDEKAIRDGCERLLTTKGYLVVKAEDGRKALEILEKNPVKIMLLDLKMPVIGGEEVLEIVRESYPHIPVIIITGHGTVDTAVKCMKRGAYDFVAKPFQVDQFLLTIKRAADKIRLEQRALLFQEENILNLYDITLEKSRVKTIINCIANGVMVTNRNMEVVLHNPALTRLLGMSNNVTNPFPMREIIDNQELIQTISRIHSGESKENEFITQEIRVGDNTLRAISAPAFGVDRHVFLIVAGAVTVLEDITVFKQLDHMKSSFVNMVAHELRSPLASIRQINNVLLEGLAGNLSPKQKELMGRGNRKIDVLLELINDLLDVAKIEAGKFVEHRTPTDLVPIILDTVSLMKPKAEEQGVSLDVECGNIGLIHADPKRMAELLGNLISNAINYSPDGGKVTVCASTHGKWIDLRVEDNGVGIPPEEMDRIFDQFYRVRHPKTRKVIGTGLGLSIVKGIVEAHSGTIEVDSVPDRGTTFKVMLPVFEQWEDEN